VCVCERGRLRTSEINRKREERKKDTKSVCVIRHKQGVKERKRTRERERERKN